MVTRQQALVARQWLDGKLAVPPDVDPNSDAGRLLAELVAFGLGLRRRVARATRTTTRTRAGDDRPPDTKLIDLRAFADSQLEILRLRCEGTHAPWLTDLSARLQRALPQAIAIAVADQ